MPEQSPVTTPPASPIISKRRHNLQRMMSSPTRQHQGSSNELIDEINAILDSATESSANQWQLLTEKDPKNKLTPLRSAISSNNASNVTEYLASAYKHKPTIEKYQELLTSGTSSLNALAPYHTNKKSRDAKNFSTAHPKSPDGRAISCHAYPNVYDIHALLRSYPNKNTRNSSMLCRACRNTYRIRTHQPG